MKVLCGWELGAGLGHVSRLKPIVLALRDAGAEVTVGLQNPALAYNFQDLEDGSPLPGISLVSTPKWPVPNDPAVRDLPTHSFADVMHIIGYNRADLVEERACRWIEVIEREAPDVILGDFAPTLKIAARGRVPMIMVGNGYTIPPPGRSLPPIRPWQDSLEPFSLDHEREILDAVNAAIGKLGKTPIEFISDLFNGDRTFVFSLPIVDPYARYRSEAQLPPFNLPRNVKSRPASARRSDRAVFYFPANHPKLGDAIDAAKRSGLDWSAYISGAPQDLIARHKSRKFRLSAEPLDFAQELPSARLVLHHGGLSTAVAATMAATPQMILPWNLEHLVTAKCVETLGATKIPQGQNLAPERLANGLANVAQNQEIHECAQGAATKVDLSDMEKGAQIVADACFELAHP